VTAPGGNGQFTMTEAALQQAEAKLNESADQVLQTITRMRETVIQESGKGDAFVASQNVAESLRQQAQKFQQYTIQLAENIGRSRKAYMANNEAGAQSITQIAQDLPTGQTFSRLSGGA
jgi:uncharacterized protein YukE